MLSNIEDNAYYQAIDRDLGACQECGVAVAEIHHIVRRGYWGKNAKHRGEVVENLICLCWLHHQGAHAKEAQRRHMTLLREKWGYEYTEQPWLGLLGQAE